MEKSGKFFEVWPQFYDGVGYSFPGLKEEQKKYFKSFLEKKESLQELLLNYAKQEMKKLNPSEGSNFSVQNLDARLLFCLNGGLGAHFSFEKDSTSESFVSVHNLEYLFYRIVAFNTMSHLLELLDPLLDTPKITEGKIYYPLPNGCNLLPIQDQFNPKTLETLFSLVNLSGKITTNLEENIQEIISDSGKISISGGLLQASSNKNLSNFSFICSKLLYFSFN